MPLAVRNLDTDLFFANGHLAADPKLAQDFPTFEDAKKVAQNLKIKNADVVTIHIDDRVTGGWPIPNCDSTKAPDRI